MSVRRKDVADVADAASNFSLRGIVTTETVGLSKAVAPHKPTTLSFSLGNNLNVAPQQPPAPPTTLTPKRPSIVSSGIKPSTANVFKIQSQAQQNANSEVMRLSAYTDDLTRRLHDVSSKLQATELQLTRTNQALIAERHSAHRKIDAMKKELASSHDNESKLRAHIQNQGRGPTVSQSQETFLSHVRSAIMPVAGDNTSSHQKEAAEELEKRVADLHKQQAALAASKEAALEQQRAAQTELEKEVLALREEHSALSAQISKMNESKAALASAIVASEQAQTSHNVKVAELAQSVSAMEQRLASLQVNVVAEQERLAGFTKEADAAQMIAEEAAKSQKASDFFDSIATAEGDLITMTELHTPEYSEDPVGEAFLADLGKQACAPEREFHDVGQSPRNLFDQNAKACMEFARAAPTAHHFTSLLDIDCNVDLLDFATLSDDVSGGPQNVMQQFVYAVVADTKAWLHDTATSVTSLDE